MTMGVDVLRAVHGYFTGLFAGILPREVANPTS
jgi:hypothetical protein